ncbi:MAG: SCO1664 family protein [Chloroflexi bacterium]|nr:SCO1664 family protein [Chloroflexota bacterium]
MAAGHEVEPARNDRRKRRAASPPPAAQRTVAVPPEEAASLLEQGEIQEYRVVPSGSNYTFTVLMSADNRGQFLAVYKPQRGERPLWDFPWGTLHLREHAAYVTSRHLGWPNIPVTVLRKGPFGVGSVQLYVPTAGQPDLFAFQEERRRELMEIALFDLLVNNADRKAGHCILGVDGRVWAIDHGLTFHVDPKLRTVLWDYCGEPIPQRLLEQLESLRDDPARRDRLRAELEPDLASEEIDAFFRRVDRFLRTRRYPRLDPNRNIPWPLV